MTLNWIASDDCCCWDFFFFTSAFAEILLTSHLNCWIVESVKKSFIPKSKSSFFQLSVCVCVCECVSMHANV